MVRLSFFRVISVSLDINYICFKMNVSRYLYLHRMSIIEKVADYIIAHYMNQFED